MGTGIVKVKKEPITLVALLNSDGIKNRIEQVLGRRAPQFSSALLTLVRSNDRLVKANPNSVMSSAMIAATLDLSIDPNLGQAYIVPYAGVAQLQIGYKGFIQLAQRSGQFAKITDTVIPCGVLISHDPLTEDLVIDWSKEKEGKPDGYVFYFELLNGFKKTVFWTYDKAMKHGLKYSQAFKAKKKDCPWITTFDAMALKSLIKLTLNKYAPLSIEMSRAIEADQSSEGEYPDNAKPEQEEPTFDAAAGAAKPVVEEAADPLDKLAQVGNTAAKTTETPKPEPIGDGKGPVSRKDF